jgi:adenylate kinase family enzyme
MEYVRPLAELGKSLAFSGSPRTPHEAEVEFPALQELFGRENVLLIYLDIDLNEMKRRIAGRRFCAANGHVIPGSPEFAHLTVCPQDGSALARRALDDESKVQTRHSEFVNLTLPVVDIAKQQAVAVFTLDGSQSIEAVHHEVAGVVERRQMPAPEL